MTSRTGVLAIGFAALVVLGGCTPIEGGSDPGTAPGPATTGAPATPATPPASPAGGTPTSGGTPSPTTTPTSSATGSPSATASPSAPATTSPPPAGGGTGSIAGLRVAGTSIVDAAGAPVRLLGVNRSGTEYACIQGWGIFDGPSDDASVAAIAAWRVNAVRVPLNETCWLGINGAPAQYSGQVYRQAIIDFVGRLNARGMAAVLDLHWAAPGTEKATGQRQMADADHAPDFWRSVATTFKNNRAVLFDLYNEPHDISWACWRDGGDCGIGYQVAGMQDMLDAVRGTGATNIVLATGNGWGGDLTGWLASRPTDPSGNLAAGWHMYDFGGCVTPSCYDSQIAPVSAAVPLVVGEFGDSDCNHDFSDRTMTWLDNHGDSYLGWAWNTYDCGGFPALIKDYSGTPTAYGEGLRAHLAALR
ncbi:glycoside hydrolase family 5 protein [Frankia sp. EI5c]|uniref:glycoside hydrolase family 5 protein n=1 Tax=Frankia sp. EI5c TaxID=683316 RepID=UPI001F5BFAF8|nr:glycoside hydrolase family 5 protein [Frankia sp. EI5c]